MTKITSCIFLDNSDKKFVLKLYKDSNYIIAKYQPYSIIDNTTYFKYGVFIIGQY